MELSSPKLKITHIFFLYFRTEVAERGTKISSPKSKKLIKIKSIFHFLH